MATNGDVSNILIRLATADVDWYAEVRQSAPEDFASPGAGYLTPPQQKSLIRQLPLAMAVREVQVFKLGIGAQFGRLTDREKRYAHHMAR